MFLRIGFLAAWFASLVAADGQVFSDSLKAGANRQAGELNLQSSESGGGKWRALKGLKVSPSGVTAESAAGAHLVIPEIAGTIRIEGDVVHAGSGFTALALGRGDLSGNFWNNLSIMVLVANDRYQVHAAGKDWIVKPGNGMLKKDGPNHLDFRLDTIARKATFLINGTTVVNGETLPANVRTDGITAAGFRFHEPVTSGKPSLSDFRVELESKAVAGMELVSPAMAFVQPEVKSVIQWTVASRGPSDEVAYVVKNYVGDEVGKGVAKLDSGNKVTLEREFTSGYAEITFTETNQTFGVVAIPPNEKSDPFFALDGALSWLELDPVRREGLAEITARSGITMVRERLGLGNITSGKGKFDFETARQFDTLRKAYAGKGVQILEILDGGKSAKPGDFPEMNASLAEVAKHWTVWGGAEASNEPDLKPVPADDYVPLVKTMSRALKDAGSKVPVVAGAFATIPPGPYFETCAANGMLDDCDAVSFHSYDRASSIAGMIHRYREWLKGSGKEAMPLWHTECGWPWVNGPASPPVGQDADSAMEIAAKAMESKACGVERHFPFVFTYYEEGLKNFSMMGREVSPLRSMAAYVQCIRMLSGKRYLGDLPGLESPVKLARVFGASEDGERIAVIYTGKIDAKAVIALKQPILKALGADGRDIQLNPDGTLQVPDGLIYLVLGKEVTLD
ncbi:MAG TPA: hypothetical protein VM511_01135, partial [Luteolibacter sp.]|nr:hypothetical protein [Luteolibacter sp.]